MEIQNWRTFSEPQFELRFKYPETTPQGRPVDVNEIRRDEAIRFHLTSQESQEIYFEVARYANLLAEESYKLFREGIEKRGVEFSAGELKETELASQPAFECFVKGPGMERVVTFIQKGETLYRVIYNPQSPLNEQILATLEFL